MSRWPLLIFRSVGQRSLSRIKRILYMLEKGTLVFYKHLYFTFVILCSRSSQIHGEQHVKKMYSTVAIDKRGHALKPVRGYSFTGEDTNTRVSWSLKNEIFFNVSIYISLMRTLKYYNFLLMGNRHIIGDFSWPDCCGLSSIGLIGDRPPSCHFHHKKLNVLAFSLICNWKSQMFLAYLRKAYIEKEQIATTLYRKSHRWYSEI